jgi:hypothetical protein
MSTENLNEKDKAAWEDERNIARKYLVEHIKPTGQIGFLDDGKDEVFLRLTMAQMVTLLAEYGVDRMCQAVTKAFGENP